MKIILDAEKEKINEKLNQVRNFREDFLQWAIDDESPAKHPENLLFYLRVFDNVDEVFIDIMNKLWNEDKAETLKESQCPHCADKEKTVKLQDEIIRKKNEQINELKNELLTEFRNYEQRNKNLSVKK